jgi:hypothetical protein
MSPILLLLIVLVLLAGLASGYGYYTGGAYARPLGIADAMLLILILAWLFLRGPTWPTSVPPVP